MTIIIVNAEDGLNFEDSASGRMEKLVVEGSGFMVNHANQNIVHYCQHYSGNGA
jgi:hypothetical protein